SCAPSRLPCWPRLVNPLALEPGYSHGVLPTRVPLVPVLVVFIFSICLTIWLPFGVNVGGLNVRASQVILPVVAFLLLLQQPRWRIAPWAFVMALGGFVWWLSLLFWTVMNVPEFGRPFGRVLLVGFNLAHAAVLYVLIVRTGKIRPAIHALIGS